MPGELMLHPGSDDSGQMAVYGSAAYAVVSFARVTQAAAQEIADAGRRINATVLGITTNPNAGRGRTGGGGGGGGWGGPPASSFGGAGGGGEAEGAAGAAEGGAEAEAAGGAAAGVLGAALVILGKVAVGTAVRLQEMSRAQVEFNRGLATVSASMAAVFAQRDVREMLRNMEVGQRLAQSARDLTQAEQDRADNTKEIEVAWERAKNRAGTIWEEFKSYVLKPLNDLARKWNAEEKRADNEIMVGEWVQAVADEDRRRRQDNQRRMPVDRR
jgi:hypothetical protein